MQRCGGPCSAAQTPGRRDRRCLRDVGDELRLPDGLFDVRAYRLGTMYARLRSRHLGDGVERIRRRRVERTDIDRAWIDFWDRSNADPRHVPATVDFEGRLVAVTVRTRCRWSNWSTVHGSACCGFSVCATSGRVRRTRRFDRSARIVRSRRLAAVVARARRRSRRGRDDGSEARRRCTSRPAGRLGVGGGRRHVGSGSHEVDGEPSSASSTGSTLQADTGSFGSSCVGTGCADRIISPVAPFVVVLAPVTLFWWPRRLR